MSKNNQKTFIFTVNQNNEVIRVQNEEFQDVELFVNLKQENSLTISLTINPDDPNNGEKPTTMELEEGRTYKKPPPRPDLVHPTDKNI